MIVIVDYGMGNVGSVLNMVKKVGGIATISSKEKDLYNAEKLILPGVGSFDEGINNLSNLNLISLLNHKVIKEHTPILGICLGMQLMTKSSEEGKESGLGWIDAQTVRFQLEDRNLKVPHMGWNYINQKKSSLLYNGETHEAHKYYFVHSYHVVCNNMEDTLTETEYGYNFVSSFERGNIFGVQFHPEKSHRYGLELMKNFVEMTQSC